MTLQELVKDFERLAGLVWGARIAMGERIAAMLKLATQAEVVRLLKEAVPAARQRIGYEITPKLITDLANVYETFVKDGGITAPGGLHHIDGNDVAAMELSPDQASKLADAVRQGVIKVKRVKRLAKRAAKGEVSEAQAKLTELLDAAKAPSVPDDEAGSFTLEARINDARALVKRREKALNEAVTELSNLERLLKDARAREAEAKAKAEESTTTPKGTAAKRTARRRASKAEHANRAEA